MSKVLEDVYEVGYRDGIVESEPTVRGLEAQRDALKAEAAKWQSLYLAAVDGLATVTAELEPWREMSRILIAGEAKYMVYGLDYDPDVEESRRWCLTLIHYIYGTTTDGMGATLPEAVNAAYAEVVGDDS